MLLVVDVVAVYVVAVNFVAAEIVLMMVDGE